MKKDSFMIRIRAGMLSAICACALTIGLLPARPLYAQSTATSQETGKQEIRRQAGENDDPFAPEEGYSLRTKGNLPAAFDLRHVNENGTEKNYITPVRQQNPFGSCWGFGAVAAAESSILSSGLVNNPRDLNLSEKQIAWYVTKALDDPNHPQNGEGIVFDQDVSDSRKYDMGGFTLYATNFFASGIGPVSEDTSTEDGEIYRYRGKKGIVVNERVTWFDDANVEQSGYKKTYYSPDDDWSMPEKYRFHQDYRLKESYLLPSPNVKAEGSSGKPEYNPEATEAIKNQLLNKRAVCVSICASHSRPGEVDDSDIGKIWAQYTLTSTQNHVVTIVGYDDNFPKTLFQDERQPPENGAWLVKNSWGADTSDFPDNGYSHWGLLEGEDRAGGNYTPVSNKHTGYFWISYYDKSLAFPEAYLFDSDTSEDLMIHQHDLMPVMEYQEYDTETEMRMANVFTADKNGRLKDVSFFTATPGSTVTFKVLLLNQTWFNPETDGECVYESSPKTYPLGGYHRESLAPDTDIVIARNQTYVVIVEEKTPSGKYGMCFGKAKSGKLGGYHVNPVINKEESFLYIDGQWQDLSSQKLQSLLLDDSEEWLLDNFPIKTSLTPVDNQGIYVMVKNLSPEYMHVLNIYEEHRFGTYFVGATDDLPTAPDIRWISTDPEVFTVKPANSEASEAVVTGKKPGKASLIVDAGVYGKKVVTIEVTKFALLYAYLGDHVIQQVYNGEPQEPELIDVYGETGGDTYKWGLVKDQDYTVSYENNTKCGKVKVTARGIGNYGSTLSTWFVILPARAKIQHISPGDHKMTVSFTSQKDSGVSGYVITYNESGSDTTKTRDVPADARSVVIDGLTAGKSYEVSMKAYVTIEEESLIIDRDTFDFYDEAENPVNYFGEESNKMTSAVIPGKETASDGDSKDSSTVAGTEKSIKSIKKDGDLKGSGFLPLRLCSKTASKDKIRLNWKKVSGADGYILYGNRCGTKYSMKKLAVLSASKKTWVHKKLKKGTYYKYLIVAYKVKDHIKKVAAASRTIHVITSGGKTVNNKSVKLSKTTVSLKKGKSLKLKAVPVPQKKGKKVKKHTAVRFESSNTKVAKVSRGGLITAKGKGTCYIYAYAQNGICKRTKVLVR